MSDEKQTNAACLDGDGRTVSREEIASAVRQALIASVERGDPPDGARIAARIGADLSRFIGRRIGGTPRGCFHDGCDEASGEEGGSHWCRLVAWYGRAW